MNGTSVLTTDAPHTRFTPERVATEEMPRRAHVRPPPRKGHRRDSNSGVRFRPKADTDWTDVFSELSRCSLNAREQNQPNDPDPIRARQLREPRSGSLLRVTRYTPRAEPQLNRVGCLPPAHELLRFRIVASIKAVTAGEPATQRLHKKDVVLRHPIPPSPRRRGGAAGPESCRTAPSWRGYKWTLSVKQ